MIQDERDLNKMFQLALRPLADRIARLEAKLEAMGSSVKADSSTFAITWAERPTNPRQGEIRYFTDKTFPAAANPGVLASYDSASGLWLSSGQDVAGM